MRFNTALLHQVEKGDKETGATLTPIYHSSAFYQSSAEQHEKLFHNKANGFSYTRINNPTILAVKCCPCGRGNFSEYEFVRRFHRCVS